MRRYNSNKGMCCIAFGLGLLVSSWCSVKIAHCSNGRHNYISWLYPVKEYGGIDMKVIVVESPKFLAAILRMIFKIKKEEF